jgi:hypothetical protein
MWWLSWRLFRFHAFVAAAALLAVGVTLLATGPHLAHLYDTIKTSCRAQSDCGAALLQFQSTDHFLQQVGMILLLVPALVGMFWGAPLLAREVETGTYKLGWTQSVSHVRWLAVKVAIGGIASVAVAGLLSLMITWWMSPFDSVIDRPFSSSFFDRRDLVPIGYAALAFAIGVTTGLLIRRTVPAMAAACAVFAGFRILDYEWIRPNLMTPLKLTTTLNVGGSPRLPNAADWVLSELTVNRAGQVIGTNGGIGTYGLRINAPPGGGLSIAGIGQCPVGATGISLPPIGPSSRTSVALQLDRAAQQCLDKLGIKDVLTYQPVTRYWTFQWFELAIYLVLAGCLLGFCFWFFRRRLR